jgi:5-methylcytosine-specific restriction endonuclease McrA
MKLTAKQFRSTAAWQRARELKLQGATHCAICQLPLYPTAPARSKWSSTVDHVIPLHNIDLGTADGRALAVNPAWLRAAHTGCNSKRGNRTAAKRRAPRVWNLTEVARRMAAERRSERW